jgi:hypothetical protein
MASECFERSEQQRVMALFKAGRSKAENGREIGKSKEQVANILAKAMREAGNA